MSGLPAALDRAVAKRVPLLCSAAAAGFVLGYLPAWGCLFRVEHWDQKFFYAARGFDPLALGDWLWIFNFNSFHLFRLMAGWGAWQFLLHRLFGSSAQLYLALNMLLHAANAALLALWVGRWSGARGREALRRGAAAGCLFLLMPACYETIAWTFFTYKTLHCLLMLGSLIAYERFVLDEGIAWAAAAGALLFVSYLFLEATLPLGIVMVLGLWLLKPGMDRRKKAVLAAAVLASWALYAAVYFPCRSYALGTLGMDDSATGFLAAWRSGWGNIPWAGFRWMIHGVALGNSGLGLKLLPLPHHLYTVAEIASAPRWALVIALWAGMGWASGLGVGSRRGAAFAAAAMAAVCGPILLGRFNDGWLYPDLRVTYLEGMSMYHYLPSLFVAAVLGHGLESALERFRGGWRARALVLLALSLLALYAATVRGVTAEYARIQEPTIRLARKVRALLREDPAARVYVEHRLPQAPTNNPLFTDEIHAYHAFHVLFGERIVPVRSLATVIVGPDSRRPGSPATAARDAASLLGRAGTLDRHGQPEQALRYARTAATLAPGSAEGRFFLGYLLGKSGLLDEAIRETELALDVDPGMAKAWNNLGFFLQQRGDVQGALRKYLRALAIEPLDPRARGNLAHAAALIERGGKRDSEAALAELQRGLDSSRRGEPDEAMRRMRLALDLDPGLAPAHYNLGYFHSLRGEADEAVGHTAAAIALDPGMANAHYNLGVLLLAGGRNSDAEAGFREAARLDPSAANARFNLGVLLSSQGRTVEAIGHCAAAFRLDPARDSPLCPRAP